MLSATVNVFLSMVAATASAFAVTTNGLVADVDGAGSSDTDGTVVSYQWDFGDGGVAFVAQPQIPPRNLNWSASGKWVHLAKVGFEKYFLHKVRRGTSEPFYEKLAMHALGIRKLRFK